MNENLWNTEDGVQPVERFWSDRFLKPVTEDTASSSSSSSSLRRDTTPKWDDRNSQSIDRQQNKFSLQGLEGGHTACPRRLFAKRLILWVCTTLVSKFDIQLKTKDFEMDTSRFGFGIKDAKNKIAFVIRRREFWVGIPYDNQIAQLPFGLILKWSDGTRIEEVITMQVAREAGLPVPKVIGYGEHPDTPHTPISILITRLPGRELGQCYKTLSDADRD
ncbi:uncharacterized protein TRUGW13939_05792 [Talaromyces rugulosus]|uniref:Aminoglycoside phosphotransferase domain-containing protein n=1 Tax=Talaromyces rugulosus TaxID=121627 RepID=A0A7H8QYX5_TALRU|nr:uncharacterized protein TRUGW13939_05792 [Talaromyces rugulosus]QKX58665.1 hypothetical protein TRUGW13939_05792 [Talaromyces rugulosus]